MAVEIGSAILQKTVGKIVEPTLRGNTGVQLPYRTGGEIAWIGKGCQPCALTFFIQLLESRCWHQQFAPHFEIWRDTSLLQLFFGNGKRDRAHGAHIERDVFAHGAIAAGDATNELAIVIAQRERHTVELQFTDVVHILASAQLMDTALPCPQLFFAVGVVERQHRRRVPHLDEALARLAADARRGSPATKSRNSLGISLSNSRSLISGLSRT